jgi:phosphoglycolate phosphatase-like HAD superfamily hydrolase
MTAAGRELFGERFSLDDVALGGRLDPHIFRDGLEKTGLAYSDDAHARLRARYLELLDAELAGRVEVLAGVHALFAQLDDSDVVEGLVTGNYRDAAAMKLAHAAIDWSRFSSSAIGDEAETRTDVAALAFARARRGRPELAPDDVVVIGDTTLDVQCAKANGFRSVAVATGGVDADTLARAGADLVLADLSDARPVLALLGAPTGARA